MTFKSIPSTILLAVVLIGGFLFFKQSNLLQRDDDSFIVGTAAGYAPFMSINADDDYEGFDYDVIIALAKQMGKTLVLKDLGSMGSLFTALNQGSIDAIIWGMSITQDRLQKVAMIHYQGAPTTAYPLMFWKTMPADIHSLADMNGKTICVEPASSQDAVLSRYESIIKLSTERVDDALLSIQYGKADAALVEPAIAQKFKNKYPDIQILEIPLAPEDQVQGIGIMINYTNSELINQVQEAVRVLQSNGTIAQCEQKWGIA